MQKQIDEIFFVSKIIECANVGNKLLLLRKEYL